MSQLSFLSIAQNKKKLKCERFLNEILKVVPWKEICDEIKPFYSKGIYGRKPKAIILKKIFC